MNDDSGDEGNDELMCVRSNLITPVYKCALYIVVFT